MPEVVPTKYCVCERDYYDALVNGTTPGFNPYYLYLVNTGTDNNLPKYTEFYYGYNRLSDFQVVKVITGQDNSNIINTIPNDKLVLEVKVNGGQEEIVGLKVKYDGVLRTLAELTAVSYLDSSGDGTKYLANDGTYKTVSGGGGGTTYQAGTYINISSGTTPTISSTLRAGTNTSISNVGGEDRISATDEKVKQAKAITTNGEYPVLLAYSTATNSTVTNVVNKTSTLKYNPSTGTLSATKFVGDGSGLTGVSGGGSPSSTTPLMDDTTPSVGSETAYARGDHIHPTDTSRVAKSGDTMTGILTCQNNTSYNTKQARNIYIYTSSDFTTNPPTGANGDICLIY